MTKKLSLISAVLAGTFVMAGSAQAALTLTGDYLKVGISDVGTFGSGGGTPPGLLHDPSGTGNFAPGGIPNDYLTPGTPHDGFGVTYSVPGAPPSGLQGNDNAGGASFVGAAPTVLAGAAALGFDNAASWSGANANLSIKNSYFFNAKDQRIRVDTVITALTGLSDLKFVRSEDPDPDVNRFNNYDTNNQRGNSLFAPEEFVGSAGTVSGLFLGFLNNSGNTYAHNTRIDTNCCSTIDPSLVLAGGGPVYPGENTGDYGLNMAWDIGALGLGESATISYYYVFGDNIDTGGGDKIPEPGMLSLLGLALAGTAVARRRKLK